MIFAVLDFVALTLGCKLTSFYHFVSVYAMHVRSMPKRG